MPYCCAHNCNERARKGGPSFHSFPQDLKLKNKWCEMVRRENFTPTQYSRLCSKHFQEDDFERQFGLHKLKKGVIPSIFVRNGDILSKRKPPVQRNSFPTQTNSSIKLDTANHNFSNLSDNENQIPFHEDLLQINDAEEKDTEDINSRSNGSERIIENKVSFKRKKFTGDFKLSDMSSPTKAKKFYESATGTIIEKNKTVKALRQKNRILESKVKDLASLLKLRREKSVLSEDAVHTLKCRIRTIYRRDISGEGREPRI